MVGYLFHCGRYTPIGNCQKMKGGGNMVEEKKAEKKTSKTSVPTNWGKIECTGCKKTKMASGERIEKLKAEKKLSTYKCRECKKASKAK